MKIQRCMVRRMGLEPTREYSHYPLKVARLPFRHLRINANSAFVIHSFYIISNNALIVNTFFKFFINCKFSQ